MWRPSELSKTVWPAQFVHRKNVWGPSKIVKITCTKSIHIFKRLNFSAAKLSCFTVSVQNVTFTVSYSASPQIYWNLLLRSFHHQKNCHAQKILQRLGHFCSVVPEQYMSLKREGRKTWRKGSAVPHLIRCHLLGSSTGADNADSTDSADSADTADRANGADRADSADTADSAGNWSRTVDRMSLVWEGFIIKIQL